MTPIFIIVVVRALFQRITIYCYCWMGVREPMQPTTAAAKGSYCLFALCTYCAINTFLNKAIFVKGCY